MKKGLLYLLVFFFITYSGCKKDSQPTAPDTGTPAKIPESTKIFTSSEVNNNLLAISPDSTTFYFDPSVTSTKNIKVNDVIALTTGDGFLRKVVSVQTVNNQLVVQTTEANLSEAIESGEGSFSQALTTSNIERVIYYTEGVSVDTNRIYKPGEEQVHISINSVIYDEDGNNSTKGDQLALNGSFNITPEINGIFQFSGFSVKKIKTEFKINEQMDLNLDMGLFQFKGVKEKKLTTINFGTFIVPVGIPPITFPVLVGPELDIIGGASIQINSNIKTGVRQNLGHTIGMLYENGNWSNYKTNNESFDFVAPTISAGLQTKFYIKPELKLKVYGTVSPYLATELYGEFDANTSLNPWWKLYGGLNVGAGVKMQIFSQTILNYGTNFLAIKLQITQAATNPPPSAPTLSSPSNGAISVGIPPTLSWNSSTGATSYTLQVSTSSSFSSYVYNQSGLTGTSQQVSGLSNSTTYYWRLSATNSYGTSSYSSVRSFTTAAGGTAPSAPTLSSPSNGATSVGIPPTLSWNSSTGAASYTLQVSTSSSFSSYVYNQSGLTGTSQQVSGLSNSTTYYWRVSATNSYGTSSYSSVRSFTTVAGGTAPSAPTLSSPSNGAVSVGIPPTLSWNSSTGAASYTLQVSTSNSFSSYVYNQSGLTGTSQQVSGLSNSTTYYWRVNATNSYGTSAYSSVRSFTTAAGGTAPSAPTLSSPSNGATGVGIPPTLSWNASTGAVSYTLQVSTSNSFSSYVYNQNGLTGTSQQVSGLSNSTTYYWRVSSTNSYGTSSYSSVWSFTTASGGGGGSSCVGVPTVTYEGKTYNTVQIGAQCWLKENLNVGTRINGNTDPSNNGTIEKYCYNNNEAYCDTFGGLYQWNEAMQYSTTPGTRGICPPGWHIPTNAEFEALAAAVNNDGNALKAIGQGTGGGQGTNTSGFSALLAGYRYYLGGFHYLSYLAYFWSSTEYSSFNARYIYLHYEYADIFFYHYVDKGYGFSVRCVKD